MADETSTPVVTMVDAVVSGEREQEFLAGFRDLNAGPRPDGLLRSDLLRGREGAWRITTLWEGPERSDAVRESGEPPAALALLDRLGAQHSHTVFALEQTYGD